MVVLRYMITFYCPINEKTNEVLKFFRGAVKFDYQHWGSVYRVHVHEWATERDLNIAHGIVNNINNFLRDMKPYIESVQDHRLRPLVVADFRVEDIPYRALFKECRFITDSISSVSKLGASVQIMEHPYTFDLIIKRSSDSVGPIADLLQTVYEIYERLARYRWK